MAKNFKSWAQIYEEIDGEDMNKPVWFVKYELFENKKQIIALDASTKEEAKTEAAFLTGLPENEIQLG